VVRSSSLATQHDHTYNLETWFHLLDQSVPEYHEMNVRKAVITAAGRHQRTLPLQTLIDRDGVEKKALEIILEEVVEAQIDEVCLVIAPGDQDAYREAGGRLASRLHFVEQPEPRGYGQALALARDFTESAPFLHLVSDHLYLSRTGVRCAHQVLELARAENCSVSAVQPTRESLLRYYGTLGGRRVPRRMDLYEIDNVLEKPTPSEAEQSLLIPGLRSGFYLCLFGIHVFTPLLLELLAEQVARHQGSEPIQLSPALARLARQERYLALEVQGTRYNIGMRYGLFTAQLALALAGKDREEVLAQLVELLALRKATEA
jgi:UTP--glucose-1-phosphate uridylyltransferase